GGRPATPRGARHAAGAGPRSPGTAYGPAQREPGGEGAGHDEPPGRRAYDALHDQAQADPGGARQAEHQEPHRRSPAFRESCSRMRCMTTIQVSVISAVGAHRSPSGNAVARTEIPTT